MINTCFDIAWDTSRRTPTLQIWHRGKLWSTDDFDAYEAALHSALETGPHTDFNVLLDQSESASQLPEIAERRRDTLKLMLEKGMQRIVLVVPGAVVGMQSSRIARDAGAPADAFIHCRSRDEAVEVLRELDAH